MTGVVVALLAICTIGKDSRVMAADIRQIQVKSILSPASGYIGAYDYTVNPYTGCHFGCSYCYVPTIFYFRKHEPTWGDRVIVKANAPDLLLKDARKGRLAGKRIFLSPNTDPYLPEERTYQITRRLLEIFVQYPPKLLVIQTRSTYVTRDLPLLEQLRERLVVGISITTDRDDIRKLFEPTCAAIPRRVATLAELHAHGIRTQASLAPLLPCNPEQLAALVAPHSNWVVVQALKQGGQGARTRKQAHAILTEHGYEDWLEGGGAVETAMASLRRAFGPRYHEAREGFSLEWLP